MDKRDVKNILISMRTHENEIVVNNLLGQMDLIEESEIREILDRFGNSEEAVRKELSERIGEKLRGHERYPVNELFTYGVLGDLVHLHLPSIAQVKGGTTRKVNTVNLYLLDAIEKVAKMKERFANIKTIYMISPILTFKVKDRASGEVKFDELGFLGKLGFETGEFSIEQLNDQEFLSENPEAMLAKNIFGSGKNVGKAHINIDRIATQEWQDKKQEIVAAFNQMGICLEEDNQSKIPTENVEGEEPGQ